MATDIELIYCANGNERFAKIAIDAGFTYGAQLPGTIYFPIQFADQDWKNPDLEKYKAAIAEHKPRMASVVDLERPEQLPEVLMWSEEIAPHVEIIMIIPKYFGSIAKLPRQIGGKKIRLGYSVPTRHGGTSVPVWEFAGWSVHLLGGSPHAQKRLCPYMDVVSVDGNMHQLMATKYCSFYDPKKSTKRGYWPSISDYDGQKWGDGTADADAPYEAFRRSCENINRYWRDY